MRGAVPVDLVLVVVVASALAFGPVTGLAAGTVGGLIQDALSSGILGMGGLAKTLVGFAAGRFATQFIVTATVPRLLVFAAATVAHALLFMGLYTLPGPAVVPRSGRGGGHPGGRQRRDRGGRGAGRRGHSPNARAAAGESGDAGEAMTADNVRDDL